MILAWSCAKMKLLDKFLYASFINKLFRFFSLCATNSTNTNTNANTTM